MVVGLGLGRHHKIVVVAMIKNGGHGGVAAAPAALQVFQKYFHQKVTNVTPASTADPGALMQNYFRHLDYVMLATARLDLRVRPVDPAKRHPQRSRARCTPSS